MTAVLLDTHTWAWSLAEPGRVSSLATAMILGAEAIFILENFATTLEKVLDKTQVKHIVG